jgi:hypothetical protein
MNEKYPGDNGIIVFGLLLSLLLILGIMLCAYVEAQMTIWIMK